MDNGRMKHFLMRRKNQPTTICPSFGDTQGILLFEVLLAILILSIGITTCLQAFHHIVGVTKRSRDYYEAQLVSADYYFSLFTTPDLAGDDGGISEHVQFDNNAITLSDAFGFRIQAIDLDPSVEGAEEEVEEGAIVEESLNVYKIITTKIAKADQTVFTLDTFHVFNKEE